MPSDKFSVVCKASEATITLYDVVDPLWGISARTIRDELLAAGEKVKTIRLRVNSPGGSIIEGTAIYNILRTHSARKIVTVDGIAASMASVVVMAGDEIEMGDGAYLMIHDPLGAAWKATAEEMRDMADLLDKMKGQIVGIYARRTGQTEDQIAQWMADETWMTADEAVANKFADRTVAGLKVAACFDPSRFTKTPSDLLLGESAMSQDIAKPVTPATPAAATLKELRAACPGADEKFLCAQLDAEATIPQAQSAWMGEQNRRLEAVQKEAADAKAAAEAAAAKPGVPALGSNGHKDDDADPIDVFDKIVDGYKAKGHAIGKAMSLAVRHHPEAHAAYLAAYNEAHPELTSRR